MAFVVKDGLVIRLDSMRGTSILQTPEPGGPAIPTLWIEAKADARLVPHCEAGTLP
jgi:hypothetical protein